MPKALSIIKRTQGGFSAVEVLLAATVFGFLVIAVSGAIIYGRASSASAGERMRATQLADEGIEVTRNLRDNSFVNLTDGPHGLVQNSGQWSFSGTSDTVGIFTRQVTVATVDSNRKTITATVSWQQNSSTSQVTVSSELTYWFALYKSWPGSVPGGSYDPPGTSDGLKVASSSHYVYLVRSGNSSPNFLIIDITNSANPVLVGSLTLPGSPTNISISGNTAYVTNSSSSNQLQVIDVSKPSLPSLISTFNCPGNAGALGLSTTNNFVYVTRSANGGNAEFCIVDTTNSKKPSLAGSYSNNVNMYEVYVSNNNAYIATGSDTQEIININIQKPTLPKFVNSVDLPGTADVLSIGGYSSSVLAGQGSTLYSLNIGNSPPTIVSSVATVGAGVINDIDFDSANNYVFLATTASSAEFQIVNATNLASMSVVRTIDTSGTLNGVSYDNTVDVVAAASSSDTQELILFTKN
ncbi:MAG TPA: beta-propeller domain-containing protein [Candidatus Saccharimonadales bacterium]|nr:beta-propeller domain-containing protein [Candidatus Saccharimonadales bacterium]